MNQQNKENNLSSIDWAISAERVNYTDAIKFMEERVAAISKGEANELIWLLEHPPLYTAGTSANLEDLTDPDRFPVFEAGRGGQFTYHGPGQRVAYIMLDITKRGRDVRAFVNSLEEWIINTLGQLEITAKRYEGRVGVWVDLPPTPELPLASDKIAAIGVRLRKWVSFHGISLNVSPDLEHFTGIVPCGISDPTAGVTSLHKLGHKLSMEEVDALLKTEFEKLFGGTKAIPSPLFK